MVETLDLSTVQKSKAKTQKKKKIQKIPVKIYVEVFGTRNLLVQFVFQLELWFARKKFQQSVTFHHHRRKLRQIAKPFLGIGEGTEGIASMWFVGRVDG
jgi:hypothetical protein